MKRALKVVMFWALFGAAWGINVWAGTGIFLMAWAYAIIVCIKRNRESKAVHERQKAQWQAFFPKMESKEIH